MLKYCFIDLETTGLDKDRHAVIQIAGIIADGDKPYAFFNHRVRPLDNKIIEAEALEVTGLTRKEIGEYAPAHQVHKDLTGTFGEHVDKYDKQDKMFFCGYNSQFDYGFLRQWFYDLDDQYFGSWFFTPPLDVMQAALLSLRLHRHEMENFKLHSVAKAMNIPVEEKQLHDAMVDVELTLAIWRKLDL